MKMYNKYLLTLIVICFLACPAILAKGKKPKLEIPNGTKIFSSSISSDTIGGNAIRAHTVILENEIEQVMPPFDQPSMSESGNITKYITPTNASVYKVNPLFEWHLPVCSEETPCTITIKEAELEEPTILSQDNIMDNQITIKPTEIGLIVGKSYTFKVSHTDSQPAYEKLLVFNYLPDSDTKNLEEELKQVKTLENFDRKIEVINIFLKNNFWFEALANLDKLILEISENSKSELSKEDLISFKEQLYSSVNSIDR